MFAPQHSEERPWSQKTLAYAKVLLRQSMDGVWSSGTNMYKYTDKELIKGAGLNWYYFGARYMDTSLGRFMQVDPLAENSISMTAYHYAAGNPIRNIDPDGMDWVDNQGSKGKVGTNSTDVDRMLVKHQKEKKEKEKNKNTNVVLIPKGSTNDEAMSNLLYSAMKTGGAVKPLMVENSSDAVKQLDQKYEKGDLSNLYVRYHGGYDDASFEIGKTHYSSTKDVKASKNLRSIGNFLNENGNFVILACHVGSPENGGVDLLSAVSNTTQRNVFGNQSWGCIYCGNLFGSFLFSSPLQDGNCGDILIYFIKNEMTEDMLLISKDLGRK
jgi:RHS repeat-associated protein